MNQEALEAEVMPVAKQGAAMVVRSQADYSLSVTYIKENKAAQAKVKEVLDPICEAAHKAHKAATGLRGRLLNPLIAGEKQAKTAGEDWQKEQETLRLAEQRRLQAAADEAARKERERLEKQAAKLKTPELKEERLEQAAMVAAPVVQIAPAVPKIEGVSTRKTWKARVSNAALVPRTFMTVNQQALDAYARATKGAMRVTGVEFYEEISTAIRSK